MKLYSKMNHGGLRTRRWGCSPLALMAVQHVVPREANWILQLGPVVLSWGPAGGVEEGRASVANELMRWGHCWWNKDGSRAYAIDWTRKLVAEEDAG